MITLTKSIPGHAPGNPDSFIAGSNHTGPDGRRFVRIGLEDSQGGRDLEVAEGSTFEFSGSTWRVAKVYEPSIDPRGPVAEFVKVEHE